MKEISKFGMLRSHASMFGRQVEYPSFLHEDYFVRGTEDEVIDGRITKKSTVVKVHPQDRMKGLTPNDFKLENIIAVGAVDSLKNSYLKYSSSGEVSDSLETPIDNILSAVDSEISANSKSEGE